MAKDIFKTLTDKSFYGKALVEKGDLYLFLGNYEESLKSYEEAKAIYDIIGDKKGEGTATEHKGDLYFQLGLYDRALEYHGEGLNLFHEGNASDLAAVALCKTGEDYFVSGEEEFGIEKLQQALDIARKDSSICYDILMRAGRVCDKYGDKYENAYDLALEMYREARKVVQKEGDKNKEKKALMNIGKIHSLNKRDDISLGIYEEVMNVSSEGGDNHGRINALFYVAEIYEKHSRTEKALKAFNECLLFYIEVGDRWGIIKTNQKLGEIYEKQGDYDKATYYYTETINELEKLRSDIKSEELRESFSEKIMPIYRKTINFFLERGNVTKAFYYLEMSRARSLLDALKRSKVNITEGADPALLEKDKKFQAEVDYLENALIAEKSLSKPDNNRISELEDKLARSLEKLKSVHDELILKNPSYAFLTGIKGPLTIEDLQKKVLKENQYLLEYFINDDKTFVWVIWKDNYSLIEIPVKEMELNERVEKFRNPFEELKSDPEHFADHLEKLENENLQDLYNIIFKPLADNVPFPKNAELIIAPDGILYYLPFEVLISGSKTGQTDNTVIFSDFSNNRFLIEDYNISYVPSSSTMDPVLREDKKDPPGLYLGIGNPYFGQGPVEQDFSEDIATGFIQLQGYELAPLPNTETQVKHIGDLFSGLGETEIYLQINATEDIVKTKSSYYKYLLFATHGLLDEESPMDSSLAFAANSRPGEDGFLKASEIINLEINSDLAVLSACETGLGKIKTGEGVIGLTRAFMYAGTPSIMVSLWSVESASTAKMVEIFYKNLISGMNKTEALRQAKLEIMKGSETIKGQEFSYNHPFFWAPFILMGESN